MLQKFSVKRHLCSVITPCIFESTANFSELAFSMFRYQYGENKLYRNFCELLKRNPDTIQELEAVPFLPIEFFKTTQVCTGQSIPSLYFESSGTTGARNSRHYIKDPKVYERSFLKNFEANYGPVKDLCILGLLPSYLERKNSSLVYMVEKLIGYSENPDSGFFLYEHLKLREILLINEKRKRKTVLIGVTYALMDFFESNPMNLFHTAVMETGGMKGRKEELSRDAVHRKLREQTGLQHIHSEYGMTELLSQAYSKAHGRFNAPPWMKILIRDPDDPLEIFAEVPQGKESIAGAVNVIDLANVNSCAFIATDDYGKLFADGSFEITGRLYNSDIRGCGLMVL